MKKDKLKLIRKVIRDERLENDESYNRSQFYDDKRTKRMRTRRAQLEHALREYEEELDYEDETLVEEQDDEDFNI